RVAGAAGDEHREFWRSVVDWLAPAVTDLRIDTPRPIAAVGLPVIVHVEAGGMRPPLQLRRPDGSLESLAQAPGVDPHHTRLAFLPTDTGVYTIAVEESDVAAAVRVIPRGRSEPSAGGSSPSSTRTSDS